MPILEPAVLNENSVSFSALRHGRELVMATAHFSAKQAHFFQRSPAAAKPDYIPLSASDDRQQNHATTWQRKFRTELVSTELYSDLRTKESLCSYLSSLFLLPEKHQ